MLLRTLKAFAAAGKCAVIFAPIFFLFLFSTILMVGGDGTAPGVTHLSAAILGNTAKLLGIASEGAVFFVVLFWSLVVYVFAFLYATMFPGNLNDNDQKTESQKSSKVAVLSIVAFVAGSLSLIAGNQNKINAEDEKRRALDFVKQNETVMQEVGGNGKVDLVSYTTARNGSVTYDIGVYGTKTIYAIVVASRNSGTSNFTLACTTPLYMGQRDPFKPCKQ
ncbi:hypothetical protein [Massilia litorea]|uniref:Uncharacterized protein n=1 Tax=Massilia litorea TaxID=2769491 RepID=A0A7L9U4Z3_9BURK|nr:hypothetical protein [Massilia litorea]QOL49362.1 hypothetical protein LPB04_21070 [Massilia litorea]